MNPLLLAPVLDIGKTIIDRFFPDKEEARAAEAEVLRMMAEGELKTVIAQLAVNAQEAANPSLLVSGWRPFFGWIGGASFAYAGIILPILTWVASILGWPAPPLLDTDFLWVVISGLLGIGTLRTYEKKANVAK